MLFLISFALGALAVPLAWDISRHGRNNILRRSGRDVLQYAPIQALFKRVHIAVERVNTAVVGASIVGALLLLAYVGLRVLDVLSDLLSRIFGWK